MTSRAVLLRFVALCLFVASVAAVDAKSIVPTMPDSERSYPDFEVWVDGQSAPVWECRVSAIPFNTVWPGHQRPIDQTELAGFVTWETDSASTEIVVKTTRDAEALKSVVVRPRSLNIEPKIDVEKKEISFSVPGTTPVVLEIAGFHNALHLLPFPSYERPKSVCAPNFRYFGPGVHEVGVIETKSGDEYFVDAGAVVYGAFHGENVENVKISGPGIVDASPYERGVANGIFRFSKSKNITIDGIVQRDPDVWTTSLFECDDITIRNTKLVGLWRYNADGIDVCNSENVLVENSFLRTFDDSLVVKGLGDNVEKSCRNIAFRNCVVWCDWGRGLELGAETRAPKFENIRFENIDVVHSTHIALDIQHGDRAAISNVVFDDIRVECDGEIPTPVYQESDEMKYVPSDGYVPNLLYIVIAKGMWSRDDANGTVDGVLFKDVAVTGDRRMSSYFLGLDADHMARNVRIENLTFNGEKVKTAEEGAISANEFVEGLEIVAE